ncbi:MAG: hypothetical protein AAFQ57_07420, partial [Cyanobacteria bacterium J06626_14]
GEGVFGRSEIPKRTDFIHAVALKLLLVILGELPPLLEGHESLRSGGCLQESDGDMRFSLA